MKSKAPLCPCGRPGKSIGNRQFKCPLGHIFDGIDDGDATINPSRRLERREEIEEARKFNDAARQKTGRRGFRF